MILPCLTAAVFLDAAFFEVVFFAATFLGVDFLETTFLVVVAFEAAFLDATAFVVAPFLTVVDLVAVAAFDTCVAPNAGATPIKTAADNIITL